MPAFTKLRISALEDLARQVRFAPPETLRRQLDRARTLAVEIDPALAYPEEWIVFRITGYRPELAGSTTFAGEALLADISGLIERLSAGARLSQSELQADRHVDLAALRKRWNVSVKTIERWRRLGLLALRVRGRQGKQRLLFPLESVELFERTQRERIREAGAYTRVGPDLEERMVRRAEAYAKLGCSLNQAARRIARRYGRALETVRQVLRRNVPRGKPWFTGRGPATPRERELVARAYWLAFEPAQVAQRLGRSVASARRIADDERAARLRGLLGVLPRAAVMTRETSLRHESVRTDLGEPGQTDLLAFVQAARAGGVALGVVERVRAEAYGILAARAAHAIELLPSQGARATALDRIETDLRWAARLKAELVRSHLPLLVRTLEGAIGRPLEEVRPAALNGLVSQAIAALSEAVDVFEPAKGGRLAGPAGLALTRIGTRFARERAAESAGRPRAVSRLTPGVAIPDWTIRLCPWQALGGRLWLEPPMRVRTVQGDPLGRDILTRHMGWGPAPATLAEIAVALRMTPMRALRLERTALHRAMAASCGGPSGR